MQPASIRIQLGGGISTKVDDKTVPATDLLRAENVVFDKLTSLKKRNGYRALSATVEGSDVDLSGGIKMGSRDRERLVFTRDRCYSRMTDQDKWSDTGAVYSVLESNRPLAKNGSQQTMPDCATLEGVTLTAWEDTQGGVWWSVVDESGRLLRAPTQADADGRSPRCVVAGNSLHAYYVVPVDEAIYVIVVDPSEPSAAVLPAILVNDIDPTNSIFDACPTGRSTGPACIAWNQSGSTNIKIGYVDQSGAIGTPGIGHPSPFIFSASRLATTPIALAYGNFNGGVTDTIAIAYVTAALAGRISFFTAGAGTTIIAATSNVTVITAVAVQRNALALVLDAAGVATAWTAWEENAVAATNHFVRMASSTIAGGTPSTFSVRSVGLVSRAFIVNEEAFATFVHDTTFFNTYLTLRLDTTTMPIPVGRLSPGEAAGLPARKHVTSANVVNDVARYCLPVRTRVISETGSDFRETGIKMFDLDFVSTSTHQQAQLGAGLYLGGACPMHYDGRTWAEQGFHFGPEVVTTTPASGGSLTASTTYEYRYWYEQTDAQGEVHLGPTSAGTIVTMGVGQTQVTHVLPTLRVTLKDRVRICVARSLAAQTGKTAQLFRVTSLDLSTAGAVNGAVINSTTVDTKTFIDRMSDAELSEQEEIYTDGGIFSNDPSPLGHVVVRHRDRLLFNDPGNPFIFRYSQSSADGFGLETPPELSFPVDPFGGAITAAASQDDRAIIWQERAIRLFSGDGPLANGDISTTGFSAPQLVTSDVGCTNPASIVMTPRGYMFQSSKGIYNIGNDGVSYVGASVEGFNNQTITRAVLLPNRTAVLFLTDAGLSLIYDYQRMAWSTATNHEGLDALVVDDELYYMRTDGSTVYQETVGEYSDAGLPITILIATAWIKMQDYLQGFYKFINAHLIGQWLSPHQLGVQYQTDYTPQFGDPVWLDATGDTSSSGWITGARAQQIGVQPILGSSYGDDDYGEGLYGGAPDEVYQWRVQLLEKGEAIQFVFTDFQKPGTFGPGFEMTEILITGGVKGPAPKPFTKGRSI